jgi:hypothetical protein
VYFKVNKAECINNLEKKRLRGEKVFDSNSVRVNIRDITHHLPDELGAWLIVEVLRSRKVSYREMREVLHIKSKLSERAMKSIEQAIAHNQLFFKNRFRNIFSSRNRDLPWQGIERIQKHQKIEIYPSYLLSIPPISVLHSDHPRNLWSGKYAVRAAELFETKDIQTTVGSDLFIDDKKNIYFDNNAWPGALNENFINDMAILAIKKSFCRISLPNFVTTEISNAFWLGYPLLDAWGHWVYEALFRIEIFSRHAQFSSMPVVISDLVPINFTDIAGELYPGINFIRLRPGTQVSSMSLWIAPIRTFQPHNVHWSEDGENLKCNGETELATDIRKRCAHNSQFWDSLVQFPEKIYIARTSALYRKSRVENILEGIAKEFGFLVIDPGSLSPAEELRLFSGAKQIFGQTGSGMFLSFLAASECKVLCVGSDFSHDGNGWAEMVAKTTGGQVNFILGKRDFIAEGFSEGLYHQDFTLSEEAINKVRDWCETAE